MSDLFGMGSQWRKINDTYCSPEARDTGPNQILLLEGEFRNGRVEAVVVPCAPQPDYTKPKLECGLVGRYQGPKCYITAGLGGHGGEYFISEVLADGFHILAQNGNRSKVIAREPRHLQLELDDENVRLFLCYGNSRESVAQGRTSITTAGQCGLRVDWTEAHFSTLNVENTDKPCFVIAPIGERGSGTRIRSDHVLDHIIRPALADCGYRAERGDEMATPGDITEQVIQRLLEDPLVIADLTEPNPNVYYELAIRHATHLPIVQIKQRNITLPFDVHGMRTIGVTLETREEIESARDRLREAVNAIDVGAGSRVQTPIPWSLKS